MNALGPTTNPLPLYHRLATLSTILHPDRQGQRRLPYTLSSGSTAVCRDAWLQQPRLGMAEAKALLTHTLHCSILRTS